MNRREMLRSIGAAAGLAGLTQAAPVFATASPTTTITVDPNVPNRIRRYNEYEKFFFEHEEFLLDEVVQPIAKEIFLETIVRPRFTFDDVRNVIELPGFEGRYLQMLFSPFKIGQIVTIAAIYGDWFGELVSDPRPNLQINQSPIIWHSLPCDTMYRIETIKGKLLEFQQSREGPDYQSLSRYPIDKADQDLHATAIRFHPDNVVHIRVNCEKHYPYGTSAFEQRKHGKTSNKLVLGKPILDDQFVHDVTEGVRELVNRFKL